MAQTIPKKEQQMNINNFKQHLQHIHGTLDDDPANKQMKHRLQENPVTCMKEYKPSDKKDKSTDKPTTASGDTLRPNSKTAQKMEKVKVKEEHEVDSMVLEYFENYFGGSLNESVSDEDIMEAVYDLVDLTEAVCEATGVQRATRAVFGKQIAKSRAKKHDNEAEGWNEYAGDLLHPGGGKPDAETKKEIKSVIHSRDIRRKASRRYKNIAKGKKPFNTNS